jgi:hypothetical protein
MKKFIILIVFSSILYSCGGSTETKPVEATYGPVGVDSSNILPPKIEHNPDSNISPITGDTLKPV